MYTNAGMSQANSAGAMVSHVILNNLPWIVLVVFASAAAAALPGAVAEAHTARPEMGLGSTAREPFDGTLSSAAEPFDGDSLAADIEDQPGGNAATDAEMLEAAGLSGAWKPFDTAELAGAAEPFDGDGLAMIVEDQPEGSASAAFEPFDSGAAGFRIEGPGGGGWSSVRMTDGGAGASSKIMLTWIGSQGARYAHLLAAGMLQ